MPLKLLNRAREKNGIVRRPSGIRRFSFWALSSYLSCLLHCFSPHHEEHREAVELKLREYLSLAQGEAEFPPSKGIRG